MAEQQSTLFKREHFIRIELDAYHHYYSFGVPGFEICLEPCAAGFDVAIYAEDGGAHRVFEECEHGKWLSPCPHCIKEGKKNFPDYGHSLEPKRCTETGDYTVPIESLFGDRKDEDWNRALEIADEMLEKYIKDRERLGEMLAGKGTKCIICGCIEDRACPGGRSWVMHDVCSRCADRISGNDLISTEEILALWRRAKTITMKDAIECTLRNRVVPVIPMDLKSGYCVSLTKVEASPGNRPTSLCSVGTHKNIPDPADAECIAKAVIGEGFRTMPAVLPGSTMRHFFKI